MGLSIIVYTGVEKINPIYDDEDVDQEEPINADTKKHYEKTFKTFVDPEYQLQAQEIKNKDVFTYTNQESILKSTCTNYSKWKYSLLSFIKNITNTLDDLLPFKELIFFSDCEGTICSSISNKLYHDFLEYNEQAILVKDPYFYEYYSKLMYGFSTASRNGIMIFS